MPRGGGGLRAHAARRLADGRRRPAYVAPALVPGLRGRGPRGAAAVVAGLGARSAGRYRGPGDPGPARGDSRFPPQPRGRDPRPERFPEASRTRGEQTPGLVPFHCQVFRDDPRPAHPGTRREETKENARMMNTWGGHSAVSWRDLRPLLRFLRTSGIAAA